MKKFVAMGVIVVVRGVGGGGGFPLRLKRKALFRCHGRRTEERKGIGVGGEEIEGTHEERRRRGFEGE